MDRVRVQKALFLFAQRSKAPDEQKYKFVPYRFGPFSWDIYPDLDRLVLAGLLTQEAVSWMSSPVYTLTRRGRTKADELAAEAPPRRYELLMDLRQFVTERSFSELLNDIYDLYPSFAKESVFRRA
jgi:hypothetical protein